MNQSARRDRENRVGTAGYEKRTQIFDEFTWHSGWNNGCIPAEPDSDFVIAYKELNGKYKENSVGGE
jgi:hypothetical protein